MVYVDLSYSKFLINRNNWILWQLETNLKALEKYIYVVQIV